MREENKCADVKNQVENAEMGRIKEAMKGMKGRERTSFLQLRIALQANRKSEEEESQGLFLSSSAQHR